MESTSSSSGHASGSFREIVHTSWPIVVGMLSTTAMGVSDTLLVGWVGKTELAAVGLGTTASFLINALFLGALNGIKIVTAQSIGAGRREVAAQVAWHGVALGLIFGLFVLSLGALGRPIFALMGGSPQIQALATEYFEVHVLSAPFWFVTIALCNHYQGSGDTRTPMKVNLLANGLNIAFDLALIFGVGPIPAMGVRGAALATVLASAAGMVVIGVHFVRRADRAGARADRQLVGRLLNVGLPIGVRYVMGVGSFAVFTAMMARMGEDELAANQIAIKIISLSFLPGYGISEAASVLTGQYIGAGQVEHARRAFRSALKLSVSVMGVAGLVFWLAPDALIGLFQDDGRVMEIGRQLLVLAAIFQIFDAVAMTATGALNGTGDTRFTMIASVAGAWLIMVPAAWVFGVFMELGAVGAWLGLTLEIVVLSAVLLHRFHSGAWEGKATA